MKDKIIHLKNNTIYKIFNSVLFLLLLGLALYSMGLLFYRQATAPSSGVWPSDIYSYIEEVLGINTTYPYPYPIMFMLGRFFYKMSGSADIGMVITGILLNGLAIIFTKLIIEKQTNSPFLSTITTICLFFLSMIYGNIFFSFGIINRYVGVNSPNPWHNMTYMAARPFMILAFFMGAITLSHYENDFKSGNKIERNTFFKYAFFSIALLLATMTKPSYTLVHMGTAGLIMLYRFIRTKTKNFRQSLSLGIFYIPTIIDLLYQYFAEFTGGAYVGDEQGIGVGLFHIWSHNSHNIPLSVILAAAFPLFTLLIHWKDLKTDSLYRFSWQLFLVGFASASIFYEKGYTEFHGNFFWGYECGLFLVFLTAIIKTVTDTLNLLKKTILKKHIIYTTIEWLLLGIHTLMGLNYFHLLLAYGINYR